MNYGNRDVRWVMIGHKIGNDKSFRNCYELWLLFKDWFTDSSKSCHGSVLKEGEVGPNETDVARKSRR